MVAFLNLLGRNARWVLAIGSVLALLAPSLSDLLRPALPFLVSSVLAMAMARMDVLAMLRSIVRPKKLLLLCLASIVLMPVTAAFYFGIAWLFGLDPANSNSLIYLAAAPPISSAAGLCFLLGFNAVLAVELTLVATLLTPILGVATVNFFLINPPLIEPLTMSLRLGGVIALGIFMALLIRWSVGAARIQRNGTMFDGLSALNMLVFILPLFDGFLEVVMANPKNAFGVFLLVIVFNFGANLAAAFSTSKITSAENAGAIGLMNGNRTIAVYVAVVPADPAFMLFVALYQFPMYLTPVFKRIFLAAAGQRNDIAKPGS